MAFWSLSLICVFFGFYTEEKIDNKLQTIDQAFAKLENSLDDKSKELYFKVRVGLALANQLTRDPHLHDDLDRFVNDLSKKNSRSLPFIKLEDSTDSGLFEYSFYTPEGKVIYQGKLQDKDFYIVGSARAWWSQMSVLFTILFYRAPAWISSSERDDLIQRGMVVVNAGELFRWHLFLAYRKNLNTELNKDLEEMELTHGNQDI
jgi:hypothetical protein